MRLPEFVKASPFTYLSLFFPMVFLVIVGSTFIIITNWPGVTGSGIDWFFNTMLLSILYIILLLGVNVSGFSCWIVSGEKQEPAKIFRTVALCLNIIVLLFWVEIQEALSLLTKQQ